MFTVLTETEPTQYWLVCEGCHQRWRLAPEQRLLPQTRRIFEEHGTCPEPCTDDADEGLLPESRRNCG